MFADFRIAKIGTEARDGKAALINAVAENLGGSEGIVGSAERSSFSKRWRRLRGMSNVNPGRGDGLS